MLGLHCYFPIRGENMTRGIKFGLLLLLLFLVASIPLAMQLETGAIEGVVMNDLGPVTNASVEVRDMVSGVFRTGSDASGHYKLENLRAGRYSLWVQAPGHDSTLIRQIIVEHGQTAHTDVHLARSRPTTSGL